ncbi:pyrroline-5-carboxylate reductase [Bimuria novae-zelandiae CBS 107.79]|uniref:Proline dehydrogenase n=1 Tax=Bimuria novae-zelandiae CBS 107.79 TaxID=1447943 RepID=A0A6A5V488_9PLEO|nr:pyrroline-5-carboxylate reductase [Bimuria novae-zelandiae CBS 107.79]
MPLQMLLRSFLIATVSSNKFLLIPSLKLLSFFAKPGRSYLFNVDRNPVLHAILKKTLYNQFCAGETAQETKACCQSLKGLGFKGVILTYAKEIVFDHKTSASHLPGDQAKTGGVSSTHDSVIEEWRVGTLASVDLIGKGDILAIKTTGGGPAVGEAFNKGELPPQQMMDALDEVATRCKERGIKIIVDAESQHFQKGIARTTLELMRKFNREPEVVIYNTYQAYLKGTPKVLEQHLAEAEKDGFTLGLKVVRGAYMLSDDRTLIHDTKEDTDEAYNGIAQGALQQKLFDFGVSRPFPALNLLLASHNKESLISAQRLHTQRVTDGLPTVPVCFAQLHGMSDAVGFSLLRDESADGEKPAVFKCSTWGSMGECIGNLGTPILRSLTEASEESGVQFTRFIACVHSTASEERLLKLFPEQKKSGKLVISRGQTLQAVQDASVIILGVDPAQVEATLKQDGLAQALKGKLLISVAAGWARRSLESIISSAQGPSNREDKTWVIRTLPNVAAQVSQSLTAIEDPDPGTPEKHIETCNAIFSQIGKTVRIAPRLMAATTAVGGSTPAFWAIICDAFIDASVAVGIPRGIAQQMVYQSMRGSAEMLQSGFQPSELRDMGTSPEGCTIGGVMVMEEAGVRGALGKALRESVTLARLMGSEREDLHVNDTKENTGRL